MKLKLRRMREIAEAPWMSVARPHAVHMRMSYGSPHEGCSVPLPRF